MTDSKRFLVDVGIKDLPFPMKVRSREQLGGQATVANVSISARIMQRFEARWIDAFIRVLHKQRDEVGIEWLTQNVEAYLDELNASRVRVDFTFPFFMEKLTPVSQEWCVVRYMSTRSANLFSAHSEPSNILRMEIPCITTYPASSLALTGGLFGQLSVIDIEVESGQITYPEDLVDIVDRHAVAPLYSYLTEVDQTFIIDQVHSVEKTSVVVTDEVKGELAHDKAIKSYSVRCSNFGMLRPYSTFLATEKNKWVPDSGWEE
jgi:GTP cyclohydrolase I